LIAQKEQEKKPLCKYKSFNEIDNGGRPRVKEAKIDLSEQIRDSMLEQEIHQQYYSLGDSSRQSNV
jgi:hypothetical protein